MINFKLHSELFIFKRNKSQIETPPLHFDELISIFEVFSSIYTNFGKGWVAKIAILAEQIIRPLKLGFLGLYLPLMTWPYLPDFSEVLTNLTITPFPQSCSQRPSHNSSSALNHCFIYIVFIEISILVIVSFKEEIIISHHS